MANNDLAECIQDHEPIGSFQPSVYSGVDEDALTFYFKNDADYGKRLNNRVTLFLSLENDDLVGCQIKGLKGIREDLPT